MCKKLISRNSVRKKSYSQVADIPSQKQIHDVGITLVFMKRKRGRNLIQVRQDKIIA